MVPPFTLAAAFFLSAHRSPRVSGKRDGYAGAMLAVTVAAVVLCTLVPRFVQGRGAGVSFDLRGIANYFFWGGIINGAMSGVAPLLLPGVLHALFFMLLAAGTIWIATSTESRERKFVVLVLFLTQTGTSLLVALTRWQRGAAHASSYRYVYMNVFLQLPLVAILIGILSERMRRVHYASGFASWVWIRRAVLTAGALPFILGLSCSLQARSQVFALETERSQCVFRIVNNENSEECISSIYYRPDPDFVRRVWSVVKERPVELNGASLLQSPISRVTSTDSRK